MTVADALDRTLDRVAGILARPLPFLAIMAAYWLLVAVLTATVFVGASIDTTEQMMFAQVWDITYDDANPPLFTWLVKTAELALGPGHAPVLLVKFACLWAMHGFLHALARQLQLPRHLVVLVGLSPLLLYYLAWDATYTYTHSLLLTACAAAAAWATARVIARPDLARYAALGAVLAVGLLAKYNFGVFALGLVLVLAVHPALHRRRSGLVTALLCVTPALVLMVVDANRLASAASGRLAVAEELDLLTVAGALLPSTLSALGRLLLPVLPLYALVFWRALATRPQAPVPTVVPVLGWALLASGMVMLAGLLAAHATAVRTPYVFMFVLIPVLLLIRLAGYPRLERAARLFMVVPLAVMLFVPPGLAVKAAVEGASCRRCFLAFDYDALAAGLREAGFTEGTIVGRLDDQGRVGGLRPHFPESRLISLRYPHFVPPERPDAGGQCALVWYTPANAGDPEAAIRGFAASALGSPPPGTPPQTIVLPLDGGSRTIAVSALVWTAAEGTCR